MKKLITALALAATGFVASASTAPVLNTISAGDTFAQYTGSVVGSDDMPSDSLFWMFEGTVGGFDSYLLMFDPVNGSANTNVKATVTFAGTVASMFTSKTTLAGSSIYQKAGVTYDWKNASGLEPRNTLVASGTSVTLNWTASSPGDYVRVLTVSAVPEPETYAMLLAGLGIMGTVIRRKQKQNQA